MKQTQLLMIQWGSVPFSRLLVWEPHRRALPPSLEPLERESRKEEESWPLGDFQLSSAAILEVYSFLKHFLELIWCPRQELLYEYKGGS